jgi:hypothetical protein
MILSLWAPSLQADMDFSSSFSGSADWNWNGGQSKRNMTVNGTDEMVTTFDSASTFGDHGYVRHTMDNSGMANGSLDMYYNMDLDISSLGANSNWKDIKLFETSLNFGNSGSEGGGAVWTTLRRNNNDNDWAFFLSVGDPWNTVASDSAFVGTLSASEEANLHLWIRYQLVETGSSGIYTIQSWMEVAADGTSIASLAASGQNGVSFDTEDIDSYLLGVVHAGNDLTGSLTFDNFRASYSSIPEPASISTLLLGGVGVFLCWETGQFLVLTTRKRVSSWF